MIHDIIKRNKQMKSIARLIVIIIVVVAPLHGQWIFFEPTMGNYGTDQYPRNMSFGANAGINLPGGLQAYGGYAVWNSSKTTVSVDTASAFIYFDASTRMTTTLVGLREMIRFNDHNYYIRVGVAYSFETTINTSEQLRSTTFSYGTVGLGSTILLEAGLGIDTQNGGQLFLGAEYNLGKIPYFEYFFDSRAKTLEELNTKRTEMGIGPLEDFFDVSGLAFKISYTITVGY